MQLVFTLCLSKFFKQKEIMTKFLKFFALIMISLICLNSLIIAAEIEVKVNRISTDGIGSKIGTITLKDSHHGLVILPNLRDLSPGNHALHIHEKSSYDPGIKNGKEVAGLMAGGHFDPTKVGNIKSHSHGKKHGDLPQLVAAADRTATSSVMTGKLIVSQLIGRSIMIHRYGENDTGKPIGGGPRYTCGVIQN